MCCMQELVTAVNLKLNLTIVILNDEAYGMIKWKQVSWFLPSNSACKQMIFCIPGVQMCFFFVLDG